MAGQGQGPGPGRAGLPSARLSWAIGGQQEVKSSISIRRKEEEGGRGRVRGNWQLAGRNRTRDPPSPTLQIKLTCLWSRWTQPPGLSKVPVPLPRTGMPRLLHTHTDRDAERERKYTSRHGHIG